MKREPKPLKPLAVGEPVRAYEGSRVYKGVVAEMGTGPSFPGAVKVVVKEGNQYTKALFHEKQCRRIRKREKQQERVEVLGQRLRFPMQIGYHKGREQWCQVLPGFEDCYRDMHYVTLTSVTAGEVLTDRRRLSEAVESFRGFLETDASDEEVDQFKSALCDALGLPKEGA